MMMHLIPFILIALATLTSFVQSTPGLRIVGGTQSTEGEFPYFVEMGGCGGTLIAPDTVLFAAHCDDFTGKQVIVGSYKKSVVSETAQMRYCAEWKPHPMWTKGGSHVNNDFALCKLDRPVQINTSRFKLVVNENPKMPMNGEDLIVIGQGRLSSGGGSPGILRDVTVPAISNDACNSQRMYGGAVTNEMLCAGFQKGQKDSCQGDSGGPLVKRVKQKDDTYLDYLVGVVSWGAGCAQANKPGVYARTSSATSFIHKTVCDDFNSVASWCNNKQKVEKCVATIDIEVNTDDYATETQWTLTERGGGKNEVMRRSYLVNNFTNKHKVCVKKRMCYDFKITDVHGDGLCATKDCGSYSIASPGRKPYAIGGDYEEGEKVTFCISNNGKQILKTKQKPPNRKKKRKSSNKKKGNQNK